MKPGSLEGAVFETEIRVNRGLLLQHLRRLYCGLPEVTLGGPLSAKGMAFNGDLVVIAAGLADVEHVPTEVGVKLKPMVLLGCVRPRDAER
jgi:hypothetical protein